MLNGKSMFATAHHPCYVLDLPEHHRFPMEKYDLLKAQLLHEGILAPSDFFQPPPIEDYMVLRCHREEYLRILKNGGWNRNEERRSGFPWSKALIQRECIIMEGTRQCARIAAKGGVAFNIAGGTHHAHHAHAEGFCLLNDLAISAYDMIDSGLDRILIIDLDVHQGNGTASITANEDRIFTFSMHGAGNYPMHKPESNLDIALEDGTTDQEYLPLLDEALDKIMAEFQPQVVLYQCGVDVLASDKLGRLSLTLEGCKQRDRMVFEACRKQGVGVACSMGGGYSEDIRTIIRAHTNTFREAVYCWS